MMTNQNISNKNKNIYIYMTFMNSTWNSMEIFYDRKKIMDIKYRN